MGKYSNWVKKTEEPDVENYYAFTGCRQKKAVLNLFFCLFMFLLHIVSGLINPPSSHSFLVFFPYVFIFLPFPFLFFASTRLFLLSDTLTKKQWDKSLGNLKRSGTALIILYAVCSACAAIFVLKHMMALTAAGTLGTELLFDGLELIQLLSAILYGLFYDKNFSGH